MLTYILILKELKLFSTRQTGKIVELVAQLFQKEIV